MLALLGVSLAARVDQHVSLRVSLLLAALAVVLRPTNLLIWLAVGGLAITRLSLSPSHSFDNDAGTVLIREAVICGSIILAISAASDRLFFGTWTVPAYKWLYFNISQSLAVFYGRNPWHYYLSQGIPLLSTTFLPFIAVGLFTTPTPEQMGSTLASNSLNALTFAVFFSLATLSAISHKEVRFIYPLLPILHVLAAPKLASYFSATEPDATGRQQPTTRIVRKPLIALIVILSAILGSYLSLFHQAAPLSVTSFIRYEFERLHPDKLGVTGQTPFLPSHNISAPPQTGDELFALFLMPCHSTPWRSHLVHPTLRARALTCEPPLHTAPGTEERRDYLDEADRFYAADAEGLYGVGFLEKEVWPHGKRGQLTDGAEDIPRYIVGFEGIEPVLERYLAGSGKTTGMKIRRTGEFWNGFFNEDWRRQGKIIVWDTGVFPSETPEWVEKSLLHEEL
jgi:GPI mannosyltransferase 3